MKLTVKCILLDDDLQGLEYLKLLCQKIEGIDIIKCFSDPADFIRTKEQLDFDVCLMDVDMPFLNGLEVAQLLPEKSFIFITAHSKFAADAFDLNAVDFVRKPVQIDRLKKAIDKVRESKHRENATEAFGVFHTDKGKMLISFNEIAYISTPEQEKRDKHLFTVDGAMHRLKNISLIQLLDILPSIFVQINKKEIIPLPMVKYIQYDEVTLKPFRQNEKPVTLSLGQKFREPFLNAIRKK